MQLTHDADGVVLADAGEDKPAPAAPVATFIAKAFGGRLGKVRAAMAALATRFEPEALHRIGVWLYEQFRPEGPADIRGWGAKDALDLQQVRSAVATET